MYAFDFFRRIFRRNNRGILICMIINLLFMESIVCAFASGGDDPALLYAFLGTLVFYFLCVCLALSPAGEALFRMQAGARRIKRREFTNRLLPLMQEVQEAAVRDNPNLHPQITLYMSRSRMPNAFALGRRTICVNRGLLELSDAEIKGILAHEFGHLSHKDTDILLVLYVSNIFVSVALAVIGFLVATSQPSEEDRRRGNGNIVSAFLLIMFLVVRWFSQLLNTMIVSRSSRKNEYLADEYAHIIGYGQDLRRALATLDDMDILEEERGILADMTRSHPHTDDRIARLDDLYDENPTAGMTYSGTPISAGHPDIFIDQARYQELPTAAAVPQRQQPRQQVQPQRQGGGMRIRPHPQAGLAEANPSFHIRPRGEQTRPERQDNAQPQQRSATFRIRSATIEECPENQTCDERNTTIHEDHTEAQPTSSGENQGGFVVSPAEKDADGTPNVKHFRIRH